MPPLVERNQSGRRQDLSNLISVADAKATPFTTMIGKGADPVNVKFSWQADAFAKPKTTGVIDGKDVDDFENAAENRAELENRLQTFWRTAKVSRKANNVSDVAGIGRKKEFAKAKAKKLIEVKRDMEVTFLSDNGAQKDTGAVPDLTRGMGKWIQNAAQSDGAADVPVQFRTPLLSINTTSTASLVESDINVVLQSMWKQRGSKMRYAALVGATLKTQFSSFTKWQSGISSSVAAIRTYQQDADSRKIMATVDFFEGDFGELELIPTDWNAYYDVNGVENIAAIRDGRGYILDIEDIELRVNSAPSSQDLEDKGGGPRALIEAVAGLQVGNPLKHGAFKPTS